MKKINILDNHFAQLIAAGEVVERPASAFKEMIENSIDAGANRITAEISHGGIKLMRITDNGSGIYRDDVKNAFLRHATSKIKQESDLERIGSLGFRGEALASICAISEVEVITKTVDETIGTKFWISPGKKTLLEDIGTPVGTVMTVKNLFFNVPARMKFLKKDSSEANLCAGVVDKLALSHPEISFRFVRDGKEAMRTAGDGETASAIYGVYGKEFFSGLLPIDYEYEGVKVRGYASRPSFSKSVRSMQNFFVNGRYIKSRLISGALEEAYKNSIMAGKFPCCVIYLTVPFGSVDVNVHPAKTEIKFSSEKTIFEAVYYSVKTALMNSDSKKIFLSHESPLSAVFASDINKIPTQITKNKFINNASITTTSKPFESVFLNSCVASEKNKIRFERNTFEENKHETVGFGEIAHEKKLLAGDKIESKSDCKNECENKIEIKPEESSEESIEESIDGTVGSIQISEVDLNSGSVEPKSSSENQSQNAKFEFSKTDSLSSQTKICSEAVQIDFEHETEDFRIIGEVFDCYIILEKGNDVILIDKHAAHERIIFEKLRKNGGSLGSQNLLMPVVVNLEKDEYDAIIENLKTLEKSGFNIEDFGRGSVVVRGIPMYLDIQETQSSITEIAQYLMSHKKSLDTKKLEWLYDNISCRSAIKAGNKTSTEEIIALVKQLSGNPDIQHCPHGRPVFVALDKRFFEKQFGRT